MKEIECLQDFTLVTFPDTTFVPNQLYKYYLSNYLYYVNQELDLDVELVDDYKYLISLSSPPPIDQVFLDLCELGASEAQLLINFPDELTGYQYEIKSVDDTQTYYEDDLIYNSKNNAYVIIIKPTEQIELPVEFILRIFINNDGNITNYVGPITFLIPGSSFNIKFGTSVEEGEVQIDDVDKYEFNLLDEFEFIPGPPPPPPPPTPEEESSDPNFIYTVFLIVGLVLLVAYYGKFLRVFK